MLHLRKCTTADCTISEPFHYFQCLYCPCRIGQEEELISSMSDDAYICLGSGQEPGCNSLYHYCMDCFQSGVPDKDAVDEGRSTYFCKPILHCFLLRDEYTVPWIQHLLSLPNYSQLNDRLIQELVDKTKNAPIPVVLDKELEMFPGNGFIHSQVILQYVQDQIHEATGLCQDLCELIVSFDELNYSGPAEFDMLGGGDGHEIFWECTHCKRVSHTCDL